MTDKRKTVFKYTCPKCGGENTMSRGRQIFCKDCGEFTEKETAKIGNLNVASNGQNMEINVVTNEEIKTKEDLVASARLI